MTLMKMTPQGEMPMEKDEEIAFLADQAALTAANTSTSLIAKAKALLDASDITYIRCGKAGVAWPPEWQTYVLALRLIVASGTGSIPAQPVYPSGT